MSEFKPGLEGIVAFETEIAEPDRDGGALRYRGVDIEDLVGRVPFEKVWGLLVDDNPEPGLQPAAPYAARDLTGNAPADVQAATAHLSGEWDLQKLIDISDEQARDDLARVSATMLSVVAQSARVADGATTPVDPELVASGVDGGDALPARVAWRGRSEARAGDRHVLDLHRRARAQRVHVHRSDRRLDRGRLRCRALVGGRRALRAAARWRPGARAADARRSGCGRLDRAVRQGPARPGRAADGLRPSRLPRRGPALATPARNGDGSRLAALRGGRGARAGRDRRAAGAQAGPPADDERRVLVGCRPRHRGRAAGARTGHVRLLADGRLVGPHPRAETAQPARSPVGRVRRAAARGRSPSG